MSLENNITSNKEEYDSGLRTNEEDSERVLKVENLKKYFGQSQGIVDRLVSDTNVVRAVDGVNLTLRSGETLAVVGESGCGKSTLGQAILNILKPNDGSVYYDNQDLSDLSEKELRPYRKDLQMIFQDPLASLNPRQTIGEIIKAPLEVHNIGKNDSDRTEMARNMVKRVGLKPGHLERYPRQFSGGQQQRVGLARALILEPKVLIADEPVSGLDVSVQAQILELLDDLQSELGIAILFITHDLSVVRYTADQVAVMYLGKIVESAETESLFSSPKHPYSKSLLSAIPRIDPSGKRERILLEGTVPSPTDIPSGCRFHTRCPAIIPPDDWKASQQSFREVFTFREKVLSEEIEPDKISRNIDSSNSNTDRELIASQIISDSNIEMEALNDSIADLVQEVAQDIADRNYESAKKKIGKNLKSPCKNEEPEKMTAENGSRASCHRLKEKYKEEARDW